MRREWKLREDRLYKGCREEGRTWAHRGRKRRRRDGGKRKTTAARWQRRSRTKKNKERTKRHWVGDEDWKSQGKNIKRRRG